MSITELSAAVEFGIIFGLLAVGVYLSFRILDFPDMTVDGSFPMGAGIVAILILGGYDPWLATLCAMLGGAAAGMVTACLNVYGRILHLLASILTMTALYSVNLRIMGAPNLSLLNEATIFKPIHEAFQNLGLTISHQHSVILMSFTMLSLVILALYWFLNTQTGLSMRATGKNRQMATSQGIKINGMIISGIVLSNSLYALSGAMFAQSTSIADINSGPGTIIVGLAAVIIGEALVHTRSLLLAMIACVLGAVAYHVVVALALNSDALGLKSSDLKLVQAVLIATAMVLPYIRQSLKKSVQSSKQGQRA
jgi:putative tryptophan/tyrosine transport system permease protein